MQCHYCLTAAYAFTHEKSQGQTIPYVLVNLAKLPTGKLAPFHVYVALSRSKGRDNIRILRDFEPDLFTKHPSEELKLEDVRLERLVDRTILEFRNGVHDYIIGLHSDQDKAA
ncbi:hypothetical protein C8J56DRAFT_805229 [Mycena floridula]|nr:hypothetical protein C8J56DRAFT_805229 [Mycena floridula]